jgi:hypothetical protein
MWSRRKPKGDPAEVSRRLREQALRVTASEVSMPPFEVAAGAWGGLLELGYPQAVATLAVFADGTASLYVSTGGGVIGAGEHDSVRAAARAFLAAMNAHLDNLSAAAETPLPEQGRARFYARTNDGTRTAEADMTELSREDHPLAPVYRAGHAVIAEMRLASEGDDR